MEFDIHSIFPGFVLEFCKTALENNDCSLKNYKTTIFLDGMHTIKKT